MKGKGPKGEMSFISIDFFSVKLAVFLELNKATLMSESKIIMNVSCRVQTALAPGFKITF